MTASFFNAREASTVVASGLTPLLARRAADRRDRCDTSTRLPRVTAASGAFPHLDSPFKQIPLRSRPGNRTELASPV